MVGAGAIVDEGQQGAVDVVGVVEVGEAHRERPILRVTRQRRKLDPSRRRQVQV